MNRNIVRHTILFYTICWTLIFAVIIVQTEDAIPIHASSVSDAVSENFSNITTTNEESVSVTLAVNTDDGGTKSDSDDNLNSEHIRSSFEEVSSSINNYDHLVDVESASQNSGVLNEVTNGGPAVAFTLNDAATVELQQRADIPSTIASQNETPVLGKFNLTKKSNAQVQPEIKTEHEIENRSEEIVTEETDKLTIDVLSTEPKDNLTSIKEAREEIPSFSEWTQKQLEEAEKKEQVNTSVQNNNLNGKQSSGAKLRSKNYASPDCGAKIVAANPEAVSPSSVLSPSRDEYKLNTCTSRIWFIVELCEAVQAKKIDLANFELFSSSPKDFTVSVSDRFPTRDWSIVGQFAAKDERDIQSFDLHPHLFGRYIKVEVKSHYGSEHFCPISLFRVYGTSEFEVLEKENQANTNPADDDDDDETLDSADGESPKNLFSSATDAVISMVKKAAEVLGNKGNASNNTAEINKKEDVDKPSLLISTCTTPSHLVVCVNCSDVLFGNIYELLSCKIKQLLSLLGVPFIKNSLYNSSICQQFGLYFQEQNKNDVSSTFFGHYLHSLFPAKYLGALCNSLAVIESKVLLNMSNQCNNISKNVDAENADIVNINTIQHIIEPSVLKTENVDTVEEDVSTDILSSETVVPEADGTVIQDFVSSSEIKPTKVFSSEDTLPSSVRVPNTQLNEESNQIQPTESLKLGEEKLSELNVVSVAPPQNEGVERLNAEGLSEFAGNAESGENGEENLDAFVPDFSSDNSQSMSQSVTPSTAPQAQKESVFLRLSNRIKALERNMSLSTQYLEELSRRYKKQVEEMQRLLDKTLATFNAESRKKDEKNKQLEEQIEELKHVVDSLVAERNSWGSLMYWIFITCAAIFVVMTFCKRSAQHKQSRIDETACELQRRHSVAVLPTVSVPKKQRRPSEECLKIKGTYKDLLICDIDSGMPKKKKKKKRGIARSNSIATLSEEVENNSRSVSSDTVFKFKPTCTSSRIIIHHKEPAQKADLDWVEHSALKNGIQEVPFLLDESEHTSLEPLIFSENNAKKNNGNATDNSPSYMKTATELRLNRSSSHNLPVKTNGRVIGTHRKTASLDEHVQFAVTNSVISSDDLHSKDEDNQAVTPKKERKGLKRIFKKVF